MKPRFPPRLQAGGSALRAHGNKPKIHIIVYFLFSPHLQKMGSDIREWPHAGCALTLGNKRHRLALLRCLTVRIWGSNARMLLMVNPNEPITHTPDGLWSNQRPAFSTRNASSIIAPQTGKCESLAETQRTCKLICPLILHLQRNLFHTSSFCWFLNEVY